MFRFTIRDALWLMVVVAVVVTWRLDGFRLTRSKQQEIDFWFPQAGDASERGAERIESLSFHYRAHLEERNAKIDKLNDDQPAA